MKEFGKLFGEKSKGIFGEQSGGPMFGERSGRHWFEALEKGLGERTAGILIYFLLFHWASGACLVPFFPIFATIFRDPRDPWWVSLLSIPVCWVPWVGVGISIGTFKGMKRSKWEKRILAAMTGSKSVFDKAESEARVIYDKAIAEAELRAKAVFDKAESEDEKDKGK